MTWRAMGSPCTQAPECMKEQKFESYFGRKIAVDASMHIYQFMVVVSAPWAAAFSLQPSSTRVQSMAHMPMGHG